MQGPALWCFVDRQRLRSSCWAASLVAAAALGLVGAAGRSPAQLASSCQRLLSVYVLPLPWTSHTRTAGGWMHHFSSLYFFQILVRVQKWTAETATCSRTTPLCARTGAVSTAMQATRGSAQCATRISWRRSRPPQPTCQPASVSEQLMLFVIWFNWNWMSHLSFDKQLMAKVFSCPGPPRTTATPPSTGSLPTLSLEVSDILNIAEKIEHLKTYPLTLQAEQQLGFPAGAAASTSSLDTAGPTVSGFPCNAIAFGFWN